jgi:transposase
MRIQGTNEQADERRARGLELLGKGLTCKRVASRIGVSKRTVERWRQDEREGVRRVRKKAGIRPRLTTKQLGRLERELKRGALAHGYAEDYWTLDRIAHLIWTVFGIRYHPSGVWHVMHRLGWSNQKPKRQAVQRDDAAIAHWVRYQWPHIKKVA